MKPAHYPSFNFDLSENVAYNNSTLPAYIREGLLSLYPDYSACSHWHEDLEFLIVRSGSMTYNVNGRLIELNTGEGIFVNSRQLHYGFSATRSECDFICILLHPRLLAANQTFYHNFVTPFLKNEECPYVHLQPNINWNSDILTMLMELFCAMGNETALFLIQRHFFHMFELLYSHAPAKVDGHVPPSPNLNTVKSMILYIQEHYQDKLTLSDIAKSGSCCKSKCSDLFKSYVKESPIAYLNKYRLKMSCTLLSDTDATITEIAYESGFNGASYYCETFHKYYGITPYEYRKKEKKSF